MQLYVLPYLHLFPICQGDLGASVIDISVSQYIHLPPVHKSYQLLNIIVGHMQSSVWLALVPICSGYCFFLLYWTGGLQMCTQASCCWLVLFLCSIFIMSQASTTMATTTTTMTCLLWYFVSPHDCYHGSLLDGASSNIRSVWYSSAATAYTEGLWRCCWPYYCAAAATSVSNVSSGLCQLCHGLPTGKFLFQSWASHCFYVLVSVMVYDFCFQVPSWMLCSPVGTQPLKFAPLQPFGAYTCQAHVQSGDGHWSTPLMHKWLLPPLLWIGGSLLLINQLSSGHSNDIVRHAALGAWQSHLISPPSNMVGMCFLFQVWFHLMTQLTLNLWWALNLLILVWCLVIRLMSLLSFGQQSGFLLNPLLILGSQVRCHHLPISPTNGVLVLFLSRPSHCQLWTGLGFHPHWFYQDTATGYILGWARLHYIFSLFWVSLLSYYYFWYFCCF